LERAGIPCAVICSDEFGPLARAESEVLGIKALPLVAIPHPLAGNKIELVRAKAVAIVEEIIGAITSSEAEIEATYAGRFSQLTERRLDGGALCVDDVCAVDLALENHANSG
jgi:hypothetical protein